MTHDPDSNAPDIAARGEPHSPLPWELIEATEHHGAYILNGYGSDVCDLYCMSDPSMPSVRNGGTSQPIAFTDANANAAFIVRAVNAHDDLLAFVKEIANFNPVFAKGHEKDRIKRARELVAKAEAALKAREA